MKNKFSLDETETEWQISQTRGIRERILNYKVPYESALIGRTKLSTREEQVKKKTTNETVWFSFSFSLREFFKKFPVHFTLSKLTFSILVFVTVIHFSWRFVIVSFKSLLTSVNYASLHRFHSSKRSTLWLKVCLIFIHENRLDLYFSFVFMQKSSNETPSTHPKEVSRISVRNRHFSRMNSIRFLFLDVRLTRKTKGTNRRLTIALSEFLCFLHENEFEQDPNIQTSSKWVSKKLWFFRRRRVKLRFCFVLKVNDSDGIRVWMNPFEGCWRISISVTPLLRCRKVIDFVWKNNLIHLGIQSFW